MSSKPLLAAACTLLLGGAVAFALIGEVDTAPPGRIAARVEPTPTAAPIATPAGGAARTLAVEPTVGQRPLPTDAEPLTITVVDSETKAPVPGAMVRWLDESAWPFLAERSPVDDVERRLLEDDLERLADLAGWSTAADAAGRARITLASDTTVLAEHAGRHGRLVVRAGSVAPPGGHTIDLEPDRVLQVRVVDANDQSCAGVFVVIRRDNWPQTRSRVSRTREADGIATFPHLQLLPQRAGEQADAPPVGEWSAGAFLLGVHDSVSRAAFSPDAPPAEPVVLRLPPCGSVRVRAEFGGNLVAGIREISLFHQSHYVVQQASAPVDALGWAHFPHVPIDLDFEAAAYWLGVCKFAGPRKPGEVVDVIVTPDQTSVSWSGRLLTPDRAPAADQSVAVRIERAGSKPTLQTMRTDANGRFVIGLLARSASERAERILFDWRSSGEPASRVELGPRTLRTGIEDLGDLMPTTPPLIAAGRITGVVGAVRDGVRLYVERHDPSAGASDAWEDVDDALLERGSDGAFTLRGTVAPGRHRLVVRGAVQPVEPVGFSPGRTDLIVDLDPGHDLAAGVLLPHGVPPELMRVELVPSPAARIPPLRRERLVQALTPQRGERHDVVWRSIASGVYALELRAWGAAEPTLCIPDVSVPGPPGGDPRLRAIDLRPLVRATHMRLVAADDGEPLVHVSGAVFPNARPAVGSWRGFEVKAAEATLVLPAGPCDLLVCCSGHRPQRLRGAAGEDFTVRMEPWPRVTVTFDGMPSLPEGVYADVSATPIAPAGGRGETPSQTYALDNLLEPSFDSHTIEDGAASVTLGESAYRLEVSVGRGALSRRLRVTEPREVLATTSHVTVRIPRDEWQQAIDAVALRK